MGGGGGGGVKKMSFQGIAQFTITSSMIYIFCSVLFCSPDRKAS